jgi:hypothetical protein
MSNYHRDDVFVAGGQPTLTYVQREDQHVERNFSRAIATPNQIVSLAGPTKTGKTVLCRKVLGQREFVWIDGGQIPSAKDLWEYVTSELNLSDEVTTTTASQISTKAEGSIPLVATAGGSLLRGTTVANKKKKISMKDAIATLLQSKIILVIDDFHYLSGDARTEVMRNVKSAVFNGLKVILLSATHRAFDAIKAENELTGRFISIKLPHWSQEDLQQIATLGFKALRIKQNATLIDRLTEEAQESPFLMQTFCWHMCFALNIERTAPLIGWHVIPETYDPTSMLVRLAEDSGLPIYQKLAAGPQSRKIRAKRPLKNGKEADIYEATLLALAETGPKPVVAYDELRSTLSAMLTDMVPQKHEITSALKHLATISKRIGAGDAIDWDEDKREINIADPYLRFYLRWHVRQR